MTDPILQTLYEDKPPAGMPLPLQALWWLKKCELKTGPEWKRAHEICQTAEGTGPFDLVHGLAHWIEGDVGNADYWYRRAGDRRGDAGLEREWQRLVDAIR